MKILKIVGKSLLSLVLFLVGILLPSLPMPFFDGPYDSGNWGSPHYYYPHVINIVVMTLLTTFLLYLFFRLLWNKKLVVFLLTIITIAIGIILVVIAMKPVSANAYRDFDNKTFVPLVVGKSGYVNYRVKKGNQILAALKEGKISNEDIAALCLVANYYEENKLEVNEGFEKIDSPVGLPVQVVGYKDYGFGFDGVVSYKDLVETLKVSNANCSSPSIDMIVIPAGSFQMGDLSGYSDEKPVHKVMIKSFAMSKTEITFAQYDTYAGAAGLDMPDDEGWGRGSRPVINVSWDDAVAYAKWLSAKNGKKYRLPTEAEWEYAARAGTSTEYSWGSDIECSKASYDGGEASKCYYEKANGDSRGTAPVGGYKPNAFGLLDMHGNVSEWVQDCYEDSYKNAPADGSAATSGKCESRVARGGAWDSRPSRLHSASRDVGTATYGYKNRGFRLVQEN